jgi:hypothetical protein
LEVLEEEETLSPLPKALSITDETRPYKNMAVRRLNGSILFSG